MVDVSKHLSRNEVNTVRRKWRAFAIAGEVTGNAKQVRTRMVVELALGTGLRVSELARLNCGDCKLGAEPMLLVERSKRRTKTEPEPLVISDGLADLLRQFIRWKRTNGESVKPDAALLCSQRGRYSISGLQKVWKIALAEAGVRVLPIHAARHTAATMALRDSKNLRLVQQMLGHRRITTTEVYASATIDELRATANACYDDDG
jgi:integrase/recombinase XerC